MAKNEVEQTKGDADRFEELERFMAESAPALQKMLDESRAPLEALLDDNRDQLEQMLQELRSDSQMDAGFQELQTQMETTSPALQKMLDEGRAPLEALLEESRPHLEELLAELSREGGQLVEPAEPIPEPDPNLTALDAARWMHAEVNRDGILHHERALYRVRYYFGVRFTRTNADGNTVLGHDVLDEFLKLTANDVVWSRKEKHWRMRRAGDRPGRLQP